jgi:GDSL-like Lipase/Acylhydrolase family
MLARRLFFKTALLVLSLVSISLTLEVSLRVAFYKSHDFAMEMWKYAVHLKRPVANPALRFVHAPNAHAFLMGVDVNINSKGLRDYEYSFAKPPRTYRIVMLGDSITFGWGVPLEATIPKLLEHELNQCRRSTVEKFEVINAGIGNYNTVQEVAYYESIGKAFKPDLVILMFFINDPEPVPAERNGFLIDRSYLAAFVTSRFDMLLRRFGKRPDWKTYYASLYENDNPGLKACEGALASLPAKAGTRVLVALLPELRQINDDSYPFIAQHQQISGFLRAKGVKVIDLINGLKDHGPESTLWIAPADDHPNGKANALIAKQLRDWLWVNGSVCSRRGLQPE